MKLSMLVLFLAFIPALLKAGTTGKIAGHVKDSQTNEALAGVKVVIDGATLGAATDVEGYFARRPSATPGNPSRTLPSRSI